MDKKPFNYVVLGERDFEVGSYLSIVNNPAYQRRLGFDPEKPNCTAVVIDDVGDLTVFRPEEGKQGFSEQTGGRGKYVHTRTDIEDLLRTAPKNGGLSGNPVGYICDTFLEPSLEQVRNAGFEPVAR